MPKIQVVVKEPGKPARPQMIENHYTESQKIVGGDIAPFGLEHNLDLVCNEDGNRLHLPYNCEIAGRHFVGTIFIAKHDQDDFLSMTRVEANNIIKKYFP